MCSRKHPYAINRPQNMKRLEGMKDRAKSFTAVGCYNMLLTDNSVINTSVPASVHCTDFLIPHMLLASVHRGCECAEGCFTFKIRRLSQ